MTTMADRLPFGDRLDAPVCTTGCSEDVWHIKGGQAGDFPCVRCGWTVRDAMAYRAARPTCATPPDFTPAPPTGPTSHRVLHICAIPAGVDDEALRQIVFHAGIPSFAVDNPYPCRRCQRVGYHSSTADRPETDALVSRLRELGALLSDERPGPPLTHYEGQIVGQEALF